MTSVSGFPAYPQVRWFTRRTHRTQHTVARLAAMDHRERVQAESAEGSSRWARYEDPGAGFQNLLPVESAGLLHFP